MPDGRRRARVTGLRVRTAAAATLVVAVVLAAAFVTLVLLQRHQLTSSLTDVARQQAVDVSRQVASEGRSVDLVTGGDQSLVQVVDSNGKVVTGSGVLAGQGPIVDLRPAPGQEQTFTSTQVPTGEGGPFVVVVRGVSGPDGQLVVISAQSLEAVQQSTSTLIGLLLIAYPAVLLAVLATSYWLTGRALAPVEAIRRRVAGIEGTAALNARVPVPPGDDEIARLASTMNSMLGRLQSAALAQQQFVADASHELKSPLATIRATHEINARHPEQADWASMTPEVLAELDRVDRLVADMLLLARSDERGLSLRRVDVDLDDLLDEEARRLRSARLEVSHQAVPVRITGDPHHLSRALRNLTDNAARYAAGPIELRLVSTGAVAQIDVINDGVPIAEADRERVFDRFTRLDESRVRHEGGTGLGLPIARQIARAHGGDLVVVPRLRGAHFRLTLPLV